MKAPKHLRPATKRWFAHVTGAYELEQHHLRLLQHAGEAWDRAEEARQAIDAEGLTYTDRFGSPRARPEAWWRFDAPEPRRRLGGTGAPWGEQQMARGVPSVWVTASNRGQWGNPPGPAIEPDDPPLFESESAYLDRLGLLQPGERE